MKEVVRRAFTALIIMAVSASVFAQDVAERKLTIHVEGALVRSALAQIRVSTGVLFVYEESVIDREQKVNLSYDDMSLRTVLNSLCFQTGLKYTIKKNMVLLTPKGAETASGSELVAVKGRVVDETGQALAGVTVYAPHSSLGTVTDIDGHFQIHLHAGELVSFNFIGMANQTVKVTTGMKPLLIKMAVDNGNLQEVVVTGYQSIDKSRYVGAVSQVKMDETLINGEISIDQMLQGAVPGMTVQMSTGQVGAAAKVRVRGTSTLLGNKEPLWVVDGVIQRDPFPMNEGDETLSADMDNLRLIAGNCISWLNPNDIETLTVLKDASATAIYGSKAANGVIVITTKKAKTDKLSISYSGTYTVGQKPNYGMYNLMNSQEKMQLSKEIADEKLSYSSGVLPIGYSYLMDQLQSKEITYDEFVARFRKYEYQNTDWFDLLFRNSFSQQHGLSISGGSEKLMNRVSFNYSKTNGEAKGNDVTSFSFNSNSILRLGRKLQVSLSLKGSDRKADGFSYGVNPFTYASTTARTIPAYNEDGSLYYHTKHSTGSGGVYLNKNYWNYNILNELDNTGNESASRMLGASVDLEWEFLPGLKYQGLYSYTTTTSDVKSWATELSYYITNIRGYEYDDPDILPNSKLEQSSRLPYGGLLQTDNMTNRSYTFRNSLLYNNTFKKIHSVTLSLGIEATSDKNKGNAAKKYGYLRYRGEKFADLPIPVYQYGSNQLWTESMAKALYEEMRTGTTITNRENNQLSEFFTGVYAFDNRYVVNFNARLDASNRFGQDSKKKFRPAWSAGLKWRLGNEHFLQDQRVIDALDLSASYGFQGNAVETVSPYLIANDGGMDANTNLYILKVKSLPYPDLGWEKTKSWNVGADVSFFSGRLTLMANIFGKNSDVLGSRDIPAENGMTSSVVFGTKMENNGYDLAVSVIPVQTRDFTWQLSLNTGVTHNKLKNNERTNTLNDFLNGTAIVNGEAYSTLWSFAFDKLDATDGKPLFRNLDIDKTDDPRDFLVKSGKLEPDFSGGLFTRFRYKGLSLQANFAVSIGGQKRLPDLYDMNNGQYGLPLPDKNSSRWIKDRWRKPGDEEHTIYPSLPTKEKTTSTNTVDGSLHLPYNEVIYSRYVAYNQSDIRVADADFIRCRQISLNYQFTAKQLKKIYLKNLNVGLSMTNPFLITFDKKWDGYDPETGGWPARKTVSLTLNATF